MPYRSDTFSSSTTSMQHLQGCQPRPHCSETGLSHQAVEQAAWSPPWSLLTSARAHPMICMLSWCPLSPELVNPSHIWPQPTHQPKMARSAALIPVLSRFDFQAATFPLQIWARALVSPVTPFWLHSRLSLLRYFPTCSL